MAGELKRPRGIRTLNCEKGRSFFSLCGVSQKAFDWGRGCKQQ